MVKHYGIDDVHFTSEGLHVFVYSSRSAEADGVKLTLIRDFIEKMQPVQAGQFVSAHPKALYRGLVAPQTVSHICPSRLDRVREGGQLLVRLRSSAYIPLQVQHGKRL